MDRPIVYSGTHRTVVCAVCEDGTCPAEDFLRHLQERDPKRALRLLKLFTTLGDTGKIFNKEHFKKIAGTDFFEFKVFRVRVPCFFLRGGLVVLTHGFEKKKDKIPAGELSTARRIREEDDTLARTKKRP